MEGADGTNETRTAEELERMILQDLRNMDGCPERGVSVTVYGIPWNAMAKQPEAPIFAVSSPSGTQ